MPDFSDYPFDRESGPCSYFPEKNCTQYFCMTHWFSDKDYIKDLDPFPEKQFYSYLKHNGFCRYHSVFYKYECENCHQCTPIRIHVKEFKPSKNQRAAWNKNQDIEVTLVKDSAQFISDERALIFREYDVYHNGQNNGFEKMSMLQANGALYHMNRGYKGVWNMEYRLNGRLIGVSILDYTEDENGHVDNLCSNYFYYETSDEILKRSLGVFSVLKEIELCRQLGIEYYYLGLYLNDCHKMNYKTNFEPYELLIGTRWVSSAFEFPEPGSVNENYPDVCYVSNDITLPVLWAAYKNGVFPWFNEDEGDPVVWQSPDLRFVITPEGFHISKTLKKFLKKSPYTYTMDKAFDEVVNQCSLMERTGQNGTWIGEKIKESYSEFHKLGYAHSVEVWHNDKLVGGFYGVLMGSLFCGESMFTIEDNSSSSAFVWFAQKFFEAGGKLIDCQVYTDNMARYGAIEITRDEYIKKIKQFQRIRLKNELF